MFITRKRPFSVAKRIWTCGTFGVLLLFAGPLATAQERVFGIDFNCNSSLAAPSQGGFRIIAGGEGAANGRSLATTVNGMEVTVSKDGSLDFDFRGWNHGESRILPGGSTTLPALVADHVNAVDGGITVTIEGLPAGTYQFTSYHLDTFRGSGLGFAQGSSATTPQTLTATLGGEVRASVQATALSSAGLNTTAIADSQIPILQFSFESDGSEPVSIHLEGQLSNADNETNILLNGFEIRTLP